jgi:hypothetical protein
MHTDMAACGSGEITQEGYDAEKERLLGKKTRSGDVRHSLPSSFMFPGF